MVVLPALGESVTEGTVTRWLKKVGEDVSVDEPLVEVSTDKVDTEIPSPAAGVLVAISVSEDETVEVGGQLAIIASAEAAKPPTAAVPPEQPATPVPTSAQPSTPPPAPPPAQPPAQPPRLPRTRQHHNRQHHPSRQRLRPLRRMPTVTSDTSLPWFANWRASTASSLASVTGTGVGGRIRKQDVLEAAKLVARQAAPAATADTSAQPASASSPSPLRGNTEKMSRLRKVIAERMIESLQVSAQLTTVVEVDVTRIAMLRQRAKNDFLTREGVKLSFLPFFAKAAVEALKVHPSVNASIDIDAGTVTYHDVENLGVAVDTERGLLVPVIHQAGDLNIAGLAKRIADVAERTRDNNISPDELSGGTFTLTNTGSRGALV